MGVPQIVKQGGSGRENNRRDSRGQEMYLEGGNEQNRMCCSFARLGAHLLQPTAEKTYDTIQTLISHGADRTETSRSERSTTQRVNNTENLTLGNTSFPPGAKNGLRAHTHDLTGER